MEVETLQILESMARSCASGEDAKWSQLDRILDEPP